MHILVQEKQNRTMRRISGKPHRPMADQYQQHAIGVQTMTAIDPVTNLFERQ